MVLQGNGVLLPIGTHQLLQCDPRVHGSPLASGLGSDNPFLRISTISGEEPWLHLASALTSAAISLGAACCMMVSIILPVQFMPALLKIWLRSVLWTELEILTSEFISFIFPSSSAGTQS